MIDLLAIGAGAALVAFVCGAVIQGIRQRPVKGRAIRRRGNGNG